MRTGELGAVGLLVAGAFTTRSAGIVALGLSLIALGIATLALVRVNAVARDQLPVHHAQAAELGDLPGRAAQVEAKLEGRRDAP